MRIGALLLAAAVALAAGAGSAQDTLKQDPHKQSADQQDARTAGPAATENAATETAPAQAAKPEETTELTIASWGGVYAESQQKAYFEPYMAMTPTVSIVQDPASAEAVARLRQMRDGGGAPWDLVDVVAADAIRLCEEGLALRIDHDDWLAPAPDGTPASADFGAFIISDCFIPQIVYSTVVGYRTDAFAAPPDSVCALFDTQRYPGKRALERRPMNNLEWALLCDGVQAADLYDVLETEAGAARAFRKLDAIRDQIVWWRRPSRPAALLQSGEAAMASAYNGRLFSLIEERKAPVAMLWDAQALDLGGWIIPTGLSEETTAAVRRFLFFATDAQRLADQARHIPYGPARRSSMPLVGDHASLGTPMAPHLPTAPKNRANVILTNYEWWADHRDDLNLKFEAWLAQ